MREGIVENTNAGHCFLRDVETWQRFFAAGADCGPAGVPSRHVRVLFEIDDSDSRGPRARNVVVIAEPAPDIEETCRDCGSTFAIDAGQQVWFSMKGLQLPVRCPACRERRRSIRGR